MKRHTMRRQLRMGVTDNYNGSGVAGYCVKAPVRLIRKIRSRFLKKDT